MHQDVVENLETVAFFRDPEDLKVASEQGRKVLPTEEPVVMAAMDEPVPAPSLAWLMSEPRRETGEQNVAALAEESRELSPVGGIIPLPDVVQAAVIHEDVEGLGLERQPEGIAHHESGPAPARRVQFQGPPDRKRLRVQPDGVEPCLGKQVGVTAFPAPDIEHPPGGLPVAAPIPMPSPTKKRLDEW